MTSTLETTGGCLCGALRYAAHGRPVDVGYCHCRVCQRSSGAPVLAWASFPNDAFAYTKGSPATYRSSPRAGREFCAACGTQIAFREDGATRVDLNVGSLDQPDSFAPQYHIWTESRIPWFETADELPRYPDAGPDGESS
ncbi:MAG: GFA family protein [Myxococcales bacterium]|nr:GFA family protein [Myxococcales bacterium]